MKFMRLGSRQDTFHTTDAGVRTVTCEVPPDLIVYVNGTRYLLHKFPLLSKSMRLQKLCSSMSHSTQTLHFPNFPGGNEAFDACAKFCYGIAVTICAHNVVAIRCAAEHLEMTEDAEERSFIHKIETFFDSFILGGWRDAIVSLQTTKALPTLCEDLGITARCIDAIASMVSNKQSKTNLTHRNEKRSWWGDDIADLELDLFWRTIVSIKALNVVPSRIIGDALRTYATLWLPKTELGIESASCKYRMVLETIVTLLPADRGTVSCKFLLKLLKVANLLSASSVLKMKLIKGIGNRLEEVRVRDLLIPGYDMLYDVDAVLFMLEEFKMQTSHGLKLKVVKLVDGYLQEIAHDPNLPLWKMISVAKAVPDIARIEHDDLYKAIDIYLKAHPELSKSERKRLCMMLDCKKLSMEACVHAAQNDLLPLRVVVQVLFLEQARGATSGSRTQISELELSKNMKELPSSQICDASSGTTTLSTTTTSGQAEDQWSNHSGGLKIPKLKPSRTTLKMKLEEEDDIEDLSVGNARGCKVKGRCASVTTRPKRMLSRLWPVSGSEKI